MLSNTTKNIALDLVNEDGWFHYFLRAGCVECDGASDSHVQLNLGACNANDGSKLVPERRYGDLFYPQW